MPLAEDVMSIKRNIANMKTSMCLLLIMLSLSLSALVANRDPAYIPDDNFRRAINFQLNRPLSSQPTIEDLWGIHGEFRGWGWGIHSIVGAEHMINVTEMMLGENLISDLSPLSGLTNLTTLSLFENHISDIMPITGLYNLVNLMLSENRIYDLTPISGLHNLELLELNNNRIITIAPLANLTTIERLLFWNNQVSDISTLATLPHLQLLYMDSNQITDLTPLSGLTELWCLNFTNNLVSDISVLSQIPRLQYIRASSNQISNLRPLSELPNLWMVDLAYNLVTDISPLSSLTGLNYLYLGGNQISNIAPLAELTGLMNLELDHNQVCDIAILSAMANLQYLGLNYNQVHDLCPISNLSNLTSLSIESNQIDDLSPISGLTDLQELFIRDNLVSDIYPLANLSNLNYLFVIGNPISKESMMLSQAWELPCYCIHFTPLAPCYPSPSRNDLATPVEATLSWQGNYDNKFAVYEVYLGTDPHLLSLVGYGSLIADSEYTFTPVLEPETQYFWRIKAYSLEDSVWSGLWSFTTGTNSEISLDESPAFSVVPPTNYPNPFNPSTTISFSVPISGNTTVEVYNNKGEKVRCLIDNYLPAGKHCVQWDGTDDRGRKVSSGRYAYIIANKQHRFTGKMVLAK
jgi:internalin A